MSTRFLDASYYQQSQQLLNNMQPRIRSAFMRSIGNIKSQTQITKLRNALNNGDINEAIQALNIEPAAFSELQTLVVETYGKSGDLTIKSNSWIYPDGSKAVVRWDMRSPLAEQYARGTFIEGLTTEQNQLARDTIADGYAFGRSTDRIARDLVGRIAPNGKRSGGIVGLDDQSARWTRNLRDKLITDPSSALNMKLNKRDKDFIRRLDGKPLTQSQIDNLMRRYENNLLIVRGRRIARTSTQDAIEAGRFEAWHQGLAKTGVPERFVDKEWIHSGRALMDRPDHMAFSGSKVRGLNTPFPLPSGAMMLHSHDTSLGAGMVDIMNCECYTKYSIDKRALREWQRLGG